LLAKDSFASSANKQSGLAFLSDYNNVKALMFQTKKAADLPELKGFQLTAQDLERNPLILRNIQKGLAERLMLEAFRVDSLKTMPLKERRELSDALRYIASTSWKEAQAISPATQAEALKFGRDWRYNGKTRRQRFAKAVQIIGSYSAGATVTGSVLSLIPFAGPIGLSLITHEMLKDFGIKVYGRDFQFSLSGLACIVGAAAGPALATEMASWTAGPAAPLVNVIANGGSAGAMHVATGLAFFTLFETQIQRNQQVHMPQSLEVLSFLLGAIATGQAEFREMGNGEGFNEHFWDRLDAFVDDMDRRLPLNA
jgi:hypothetical protein